MSLGRRVVSGLGWIAGARFAGQLVAWGVTLLVMRILSPDDYGLLAMATVFIGFLSLFSEFGLGAAVVYARDIDTGILRKLFGMVLAVHFGLFLLVFVTAPAVAGFYSEPRLTTIIRVLALQFLVIAPCIMPEALLQRGMEFKWRSIVDLSSTVVGGMSTLGLALAGFEVWSLVYGSLIQLMWRTVGINLVHPFLHLPSFNFGGVGHSFRFGGYVAVSRVLLFTYSQADTVIGGRLLGKEALGHYSVAVHLASLPLQRVSAVINQVLFPAFASIQDDPERFARNLVGGVRMLSLFSFPVFWGMSAAAPEIVLVLLGEKWAPAILPLQVVALVMPLRMVGQLMPPTLQAVGRADVLAGSQFLALLTMPAAFLLGAQFGIVGLSAAWLVGFPVLFGLNMRRWLPLVRVQARALLGAMVRPAVAAAGMYAAVAALRAVGIAGGLALLGLLVVGGAVAYVLLSWAINRSGLLEVLSLVRVRRAPAGSGTG